MSTYYVARDDLCSWRNEKAAEQKRTAASVKLVGDRRNKSAKPKFDNTGIP